MAFGFTYTLPTITGSHSDFPVRMLTADFPSAAIDGTGDAIDNGGGNLVAYTDSGKGTQLPVEVVTFVSSGSPEAEVHIKIPTAATSNTIFIEADDVQTSQPAVTSTFGRNAVWSDYDVVYHFDSANELTDSAGNHDLTETGTMASVTGKIGDGTSGAMSISNFYTATGYKGVTGSTNRTISGWYNKTGAAGAGLVTFGDTPNFERWTVRVDGGSLRTELQGYGLTSGAFTTGVYVKFASILDGTTLADINNYIDGSLSSPGSGATTVNTVGTNDTIICASTTNFSTIAFASNETDELRIRPSAVSADWEATEYDNQNAASNWGTVGTWADSGSQTITANQVSETNLAQAIAVGIGAVSILLGQVTETDLAQPIIPVNAIVVQIGQVVESNAAQVITPIADNIDVAINQVSEINLAQTIAPVAGNVDIAINQVSEVNVAQSLTVVQGNNIAINQVSETNLAQPLTPANTISIIIGQVSENNIAQPLTLVQDQFVAINQVSEVDLAQPIIAFAGIVNPTDVDDLRVTSINRISVVSLTPSTSVTSINKLTVRSIS